MGKSTELRTMAETFSRLGSATLGESGGHPLSPWVKPIWRGARLSAPAYPVVCAPGDNLALHVALAEAPAGSALVASVGDLPARGYWGEVMTVAAVCRGVAGLVIDGCVRDTESLERRGFPVFAKGVALRGTTKDRGGSVGLPVNLGGALVHSGDWLVGDADGVTLIRAGDLEAVIAAGEKREEKEARLFDALRSGATTMQLLSLSPDAVEVHTAEKRPRPSPKSP